MPRMSQSYTRITHFSNKVKVEVEQYHVKEDVSQWAKEDGTRHIQGKAPSKLTKAEIKK